MTFHSYNNAKKQAVANANYFNVPYVVFRDTSLNWRVCKLSIAPKNVSGGIEIYYPSKSILK